MSYDAEKASAAAAFSEESVRRGFIKKVGIVTKSPTIIIIICFQVYSILSVQLLITFGTVALFNQSSGVHDLFLENYGKYNQEPNTAFWAVFAVSAIAGFIIILAELRNVKSFTRSKSSKPNFTPRKARKSRQI